MLNFRDLFVFFFWWLLFESLYRSHWTANSIVILGWGQMSDVWKSIHIYLRSGAFWTKDRSSRHIGIVSFCVLTSLVMPSSLSETIAFGFMSTRWLFFGLIMPPCGSKSTILSLFHGFRFFLFLWSFFSKHCWVSSQKVFYSHVHIFSVIRNSMWIKLKIFAFLVLLDWVQSLCPSNLSPKSYVLILRAVTYIVYRHPIIFQAATNIDSLWITIRIDFFTLFNLLLLFDWITSALSHFIEYR